MRVASLAVLLGAACVSGSLRGRRGLQDVEMIPAEEAAQLEAAEEAQREQASLAAAEAAAKLEAALKAAEEAKAAKAAAEARLAETPEVTLEEPVERQAVEELASAPVEEAAVGMATTEVPEAPELQTLAQEAEGLVEQLKAALAQEETVLAAVTAKLSEIERAQGGEASGEASGSTTEPREEVPTTEPHEEVLPAEPATREVIEATETSRKLAAATWNMAAINNNPFEYWITYEGEGGEAYGELMDKISEFLSDPGDGDVAVSTIFTEDMFHELVQTMEQASLATPEELDTVVNDYWREDYSQRLIVSGILKDPKLGSKRLVSMPDRVTNTIQLADGSKAMRPTVINCYGDELPDVASWWAKWREFMFATPLETAPGSSKTPIAMLPKISKAKYPSIEVEEEALSIPLSATLLAIFDAILVHIANAASTQWQPIRSKMCHALNERKNDRTAEILETALYNDEDVIFLQESSMTFAALARSRALGTQYYDILTPTQIDESRDQNSLILLKKGAWTNPVDVTDKVAPSLVDPKTGRSRVALGDLCVYQATRLLDDKKYLLASFHGDTNGLATVPVVDAVHFYRKHELASNDEEGSYSLLFGLDANTHYECIDESTGEALRACVTDFAASFSVHHIDSVYGDNIEDPAAYGYTTFNARTYLQPQLNKAVKESEKTISPLVDKNPKDFILFYEADLKLAEPALKDNTGLGTFVEDIVFPTLTFPSDHAITRALLVDKNFDLPTATF
mmetsp:Transcript_7827/g.23973  ORF Transcript_7827/g.23973 Transcript_7827/m.23973 type:complete len:743 (+) Transcript_7827:47-2275(+)